LNNTQFIDVVIGLAQVILVAATLGYLAIQVRSETRAIGFQVYSKVSDSYIQLGWMTADHPEFDDIWIPWGADPRGAELAEAQRKGREAGFPWGAWRIMTDAERLSYRFTRSSLETLEQAWQLRQSELVNADTYSKWQRALSMWKTSRYFEFVFEDTSPRLIAGFCDHIRILPAQS